VTSRLFHNRYADRITGIILHWPESLIAVWSFVRFLFFRIEEKTVLMVEPNAFHAEVLPGFYKYFDDLGYKVILFCRYANTTEGVFCRCTKTPPIFVFSPFWMRIALQLNKLRDIDFILFTSKKMFDQHAHIWGEYIGCLKSKPKARYGYFFVEHNFDPGKESCQVDYQNTFLLSRKSYNGIDMPILNPHWFGEVKHTQLSQDKRKFIFIGGGSIYKDSIQELVETVRILEQDYEFEVWVIGKGTDAFSAESLPQSIRFWGRLPFDKVYELLEKADFLLPLLDPANENHQQYLKGVTSGSRQLALGFNIIPIIHQEFAKHYGFGKDNAILHENQKLTDAMKCALQISSEEYKMKQLALAQLRDQIYDISLKNLQTAISICKLP
jgi:hypothetical protein